MLKGHIILCIIAVFALSACKKDNGFGSEKIPSESTLDLIYDESSDLEALTVYENPIRTDRMLFNYMGHIEQTVFGKTTANVTVQYGLPADISIENAPYTVKSANLYFFYDNYFGDTTAPVSFSVHRLSHQINNSQIYYSDFVPQYEGEVLGEVQNMMIMPNTAIPLRDDDTIKLSGFVKIPIDIAYAEEIRDLLETGLITNDTLFHNRFPGLYIQTSPVQSGKCMIQLDLTHLSSGLVIDLEDNEGKAQVLVLPFTSSKFVHTGFVHDYTGTKVSEAIENGANNPDNKLYVQSQAGIKAEIKFLNLEKYKGKLINKAVLEVYEVQKPEPNFLRTLSLFPLKKGKNGQNESLEDYSADMFGPAFVDSSLKSDNGETLYRYQVNITNLLKNYAFGKNDFSSIYLTNYPVFSSQPKFILDDNNTVKSRYVEPATLIFGSPNFAENEKKMKFKIWYSTKK